MVLLIAQRLSRAMLFRGNKGINNCTAATLKGIKIGHLAMRCPVNNPYSEKSELLLGLLSL